MKLIITEDIIGRIDDLKQYAEDHVFKLDDLKKIIAGKKDAVGDDEKFVMWIGDYRITYSIEENLNGFYKHISVSNNFEAPSPDIFGFILNIFGMRQLNKEMFQAGKQHLYFEHDNKVPNVLERIEIEHGMGKWKLLPCSPDVCQECAIDNF